MSVQVGRQIRNEIDKLFPDISGLTFFAIHTFLFRIESLALTEDQINFLVWKIENRRNASKQV